MLRLSIPKSLKSWFYDLHFLTKSVVHSDIDAHIRKYLASRPCRDSLIRLDSKYGGVFIWRG